MYEVNLDTWKPERREEGKKTIDERTSVKKRQMPIQTYKKKA